MRLRGGSSWQGLIIDQIGLVWMYLLYQCLEYPLPSFFIGEDSSMLGLILIILLVVLLLAVIPAWPYSSGWGYYPSGLLVVVLVVVIVLLLVGIL
jgi:asparagine N-glycosylation enzyme membrane subunit Stt3